MAAVNNQLSFLRVLENLHEVFKRISLETDRDFHDEKLHHSSNMRGSEHKKSNEERRDLYVPQSKIGLLIGKGGENVKRIELETRTKIQVNDDNETSYGSKVCTIIGTFASIEKAVDQIEDIIGRVKQNASHQRQYKVDTRTQPYNLNSAHDRNSREAMLQRDTITNSASLPHHINSIRSDYLEGKGESATLSLVNMLNTMVSRHGKSLAIQDIKSLFGLESYLLGCRLIRSKSIHFSLIKLYQSLLLQKDVANLNAVYCFILEDISQAYHQLSGGKSLEFQWTDSMPSNHSTFRSDEDALIALQCDLVYLSVLGHGNVSLIALWGLEPSYFQLLCVHLSPLLDLFMNKFPHLQFTIVKMLFSYCSRHNHFISSSPMIMDDELETSPGPSKTFKSFSNMVSHSPSSQNLTKSLKLIQSLLEISINGKKKENLTLLCLEWLLEILSKSSSYLRRMLNSADMESLILLVNHRLQVLEGKAFMAACEILSIILRFCPEQANNIPGITDTINTMGITYINSQSSEVRAAALKLLSLASFSPFSPNVKIHHSALTDMKESIFRKENIANPSLDSFRQIVLFMLHHEHNEDMDQDVCRKIFCDNFQAAYKRIEENEINLEKAISMDDRLLYFWTSWAVIQAAVKNKLKSPFGKAQDTLKILESAFHHKVQLVFSGMTVQKENSNMSQITQSKLAINFFRMLEIYISHITDRSPGKEDYSAFYNTNKETMTEWFVRNRKGIIILALHVQDPASAWEQAEYIIDICLKNNSKGNVSTHYVQSILIFMVSALIQLKCSEAIEGYLMLAKNHFDISCDWMKPAIKEAKLQYELAGPEYMQLFINSRQSNSEQVTGFLAKRALNCFIQLQNWQNAFQILQMFSNKPTNSNPILPWMDVDSLRRLSMYDSDIKNPRIRYPSSGLIRLDIEESLMDAESSIMNVINGMVTDCARNDDISQVVTQKVYPLLRSSIHSDTLSSSAMPLCLLKVCVKLEQLTETKQIPHNEKVDALSYDSMDSEALLYWLRWMNRLDITASHIKTRHDSKWFDPQSKCDLYLKLSKRARKEGNFLLSMSSLINYKQVAEGKPTDMIPIPQSASYQSQLTYLGQMCKASLVSESLDDTSLLMLSKIYQASGDNLSSIQVLTHHLSRVRDSVKNVDAYKTSGSKSLRLLAEATQNEFKRNGSTSNKLVVNLVRTIQNLDHVQLKDFSNLSHSQTVIYNLLQRSVSYNESDGKAWFALASWSYKQGRLLDSATNEELIPINNTLNTREDDENSDYYKLSASAYFKYLILEDNSSLNGIVATLRLLRLIIKYCSVMQSVIQNGIATTPVGPWRNIILQLFARLSHPDAAVRQIISQLLYRICKECPKQVIYSLVARSMMSKAHYFIEKNMETENIDEITSATDKLAVLDIQVDENDVFKNDDGETVSQDSGEEIGDEQFEPESAFQNVFVHLVNELSKNEPRLFEEAKVLVSELSRITILWDELWHSALTSHHSETRKMVAHLEDETKKIFPNYTLSKEEKIEMARQKVKHYFRRVTDMLTKCQEVSRALPSTPHELWFQRNFDKLIHDTVKLFSNPPEEALQKPKLFLSVYENLLSNLESKSLEMNTNRGQLVMSSISPSLSNLSATIIPMPGVSHDISIHKVGKTVNILHTKTKPKKISLYGQDGRTYSYLVKGHEDLHLDERMMQFLTITNKMLDKHSALRGLKARNYVVLPLGTKSGLIQWVPSCSALFSIYKKYLTRFDLPCKPVEAFTNRLKRKGIISKNREDWSTDILLQIHKELVADTPKSIIRSELRKSSVSAGLFWTMTQNFTKSSATMTSIGYIIGLGDRHLDNILLDPGTGEIIHIDYNVCFEKGKILRVPERVPARLTQNVVEAFGPVGVEGTFRIACESVLRICRQNREILLNLLEAFVYDPLIDWTPQGNELLLTDKQHASILESLQPQQQSATTQSSSLNPLGHVEEQLTKLRLSFNKMHQILLAAVENQQGDALLIETTHGMSHLQDMVRFIAYTIFGTSSLCDASYGLIAVVRQRKYQKSVTKLRWIVDQVQKTIIEKLDEMSSWICARESILFSTCGPLVLSECIAVLESSRKLLCHETAAFGPLFNVEHSSYSVGTDRRQQDKNAYASGVWKKVKVKLDGRDISPEYKASPAQQVDMLIAQSTSLSNLSSMYEGWTSWV